MKFISGWRVPLSEEQFIDAGLARFYDEHARRFMGPIYRKFIARFAGISIDGKRVLDIGTGSGRLAIELARVRPDWQITGVDISESMLKIARQNAEEMGFSNRIDFRQASSAALPFPDGYFSMVISNSSLHLWKDPLEVFREIARVTSSGGYCFIRDNLRLAMLSPVFCLIGRLMGMNAPQRRLWLQAIRSSYTISEVKAMLRESAIKEARVTLIPEILYLGIEWRKP